MTFRITPFEATAALLIVGVYYLLLLHVVAVRTASWHGLLLLWFMLRGIFYDGPLWLVDLPGVRAFLEWGPVLWFRRWLLRPLLASVVALLLWIPFDVPGEWDNVGVGLGVFALGLVFFNTPLARRAEETVTHWLSRNWKSLLFLAANVVAWFIDVFKIVLDYLERAIYAVDEWLRFRPGDSKFSLVWKPAVGLVWFFVTYAIRIVIHLFVEPTVNPVKHFPAVTVGAKLIIPMIPAMTVAMKDMFSPFLGVALAVAIAGAVVALLPGIFGFAVWEFKENWKLYQANRSRNLRPVMIGHHGETMGRLLRPGFHSGTVPKAFGKLRRAVRTGNARKIHNQSENLHHVSKAVAHFTERELLGLLRLSKNGGGLHIEVGKVSLATNRVRIELTCREGEGEGAPMVLSFVLLSGTLEAVMDAPGWLTRLSPDQAASFGTALAGWHQLAGVEVLRPAGSECQKGTPDACPRISWNGWVAAWEKERQGLRPVLGRRWIL